MKPNEDLSYQGKSFSRQFALKAPIQSRSKTSNGKSPAKLQLDPGQQPLGVARPLSAICQTSYKKTVLRRDSKSAGIRSGSASKKTLSRLDSLLSCVLNIEDVNLSDDEDDDDLNRNGREDFFGQRIYNACCRRTGVRPILNVAVHLRKSEVCVRHRAMTAADVKPLAVSLVSNPYVNVLDLGSNMIGSTGALYVCDLLRENVFISRLDLSDNAIGGKGARSLCYLLQSNKILQALCISGNSLEDGDSKCIAKMLMENYTLQELDISHNKFGARSGAILGKAIAENATLKKLNLSWNLLRLQSAETLCTALKLNAGLKLVNLRFNGLGLHGCRGLQKALADNTTLTELNISHNRIDGRALTLLLDGLRHNIGLEILKLGDNPIHISLTTSILTTIKTNENSAMKYLDLTHITVEPKFLEELQTMRNQSYELQVTYDLIHSCSIQNNHKKKLIATEEPLMLLYRYIQDKNLRLVDIFNILDEDKSMTVDKEEFSRGMKRAGIHIPPDTLALMMKKLDANGDGQIDFSELVDGHTKIRRRIFRQKLREQAYMERQRADPLAIMEDVKTTDRLLSRVPSTLTAKSFLPSLTKLLLTT
ncbi:hypothetical protein LSH36_1g25003 [Paralvinella palmiformis]|uniref:EF-hand domain-containing protein n=1 Tax=Paralvinella palmiformis TaxID=53620 RepID=A0AAD9NHQ9_9ANNE|nr:hypothetical protein LSH36_1g25003 [Paralvinella palmiformis]